nr:MAG TPA: hypothetical protein [Caudoviricetes sp.]
MTKEELEQVKSTFPWHYTTTRGKFGIVMSVCDNTGKVVDAKTMVEFLVMITQMIHNKDQKK